MFNIKNALDISHFLIKNHVKEGDRVLDATLGKANDSKLLAELVGPSGLVYAFDIQEEAIDIAKDLLVKNNLQDRVRLIKDSHIYLDKYIEEEISLVIYNLGYLPGFDKSICTRADSTLVSIGKALNLLKKGGLILLVAYSGHAGGLEEKEAVEEYIKSLNQRAYRATKIDFINQVNSPPCIFIIERIA